MNDTLLTSLIALGGVIVGTVLTSINNQRIKSKEAKLRILEKVFDKRIDAHEQILMVVKQIRSVTSTGITDEHYNVISYPNALQSQQDLSSFMNHTFSIIHMNTHWLNTKLERELNFYQDYMVSLSQRVQPCSDETLRRIGLVVKQDFIDLASSLENLAFDFYRSDIYKLKINKHDEWHKYPKTKTFERLNATRLQTERQEIERIKNIA